MIRFLFLVSVLLLPGCGTGLDSKKAETKGWETSRPDPESDTSQPHDNRMVTAAEMRQLLGANENARFEKTGRHFTTAMLGSSGVKSLDPLAGQPLRMLDLTKTAVSDLTPLTGAPLEKLVMVETPVRDLTPLAGMPLDLLDASRTEVEDIAPVASMTRLEELYLEGAKVRDLTPLKDSRVAKLWLNGCPIESLEPLRGKSFIELNLCDTAITELELIGTMNLGTLWLRNTAVTDLSPLRKLSLVSLDLQGTPVSDLGPLSEIPTLERLNISRTKVTDLTPLAGLPLTRLIFTPGRISAGIEAIRAMRTLRELDTSFEGTAQALAPSEFWERFDRGEFKEETPPQ